MVKPQARGKTTPEKATAGEGKGAPGTGNMENDFLEPPDGQQTTNNQENKNAAADDYQPNPQETSERNKTIISIPREMRTMEKTTTSRRRRKCQERNKTIIQTHRKMRKMRRRRGKQRKRDQ